MRLSGKGLFLQLLNQEVILECDPERLVVLSGADVPNGSEHGGGVTARVTKSGDSHHDEIIHQDTSDREAANSGCIPAAR